MQCTTEKEPECHSPRHTCQADKLDAKTLQPRINLQLSCIQFQVSVLCTTTQLNPELSCTRPSPASPSEGMSLLAHRLSLASRTALSFGWFYGIDNLFKSQPLRNGMPKKSHCFARWLEGRLYRSRPWFRPLRGTAALDASKRQNRVARGNENLITA